jgi:hypothetical protein
MSRWTDYDGDYEDEDYEERARQWRDDYYAALRSESGRQVLTGLREALMALPERRLIQSAMCTVGGPDKRAPEMTDQEVAEYAERYAGYGGVAAQRRYEWAEHEREERARLRAELSGLIARDGEGVCAIGAYVWHQKVKDGADPAEAFGSLPLLFDHEDGDPMTETTDLGTNAGIAYTLAWELAYMNDETFRDKTPEERHAAFVAWIDEQLAMEATHAQ